MRGVEQENQFVRPLPSVSRGYRCASRSPSATIEFSADKPCQTVDSAADHSTFHSLEVEPTIFRTEKQSRLSCVELGMVGAAQRFEQAAV